MKDMKKIKRLKTDFLFPTPSFLIGMGSVFNIAGNYYKFNYSNSNKEADSKAIFSDWKIVGQDLKKAEKEINKLLVDKSK